MGRRATLILLLVLVLGTALLMLVSLKSSAFRFHESKIYPTQMWVESKLSINYTIDHTLLKLSPSTDKRSLAFINSTNIDQFHVITNFILLNNARVKANIKLVSHQSLSLEDAVILRNREIEDVLQRNLLHHRVAAVHILYQDFATVEYISMLKIAKAGQIVFHHVDHEPSYADAFNYASKFLVGRLMIFMNQDIILGEGWERVDRIKMRDKKLMYALSRHAMPGGKCNNEYTCDEGQRDVGSHDAFAYFVEKPLPEETFKEVELKSDALGIENLLLWIFQTKLQYKVLNPCKVLFIYHNHCVRIHSKDRPRFNNNGKSGRAPFTDSLE